jgi:hypothetical protein
VARILIVAGGCRGRGLASRLTDAGHAVRTTTRDPARRELIEATGAECWVGTPDRLATLRGALDGVTVLCWLLACASGDPDSLRELHGNRLRFFLGEAIDTTVRGVVYETGAEGDADGHVGAGARIVRSVAERNSIPTAFLTPPADPPEPWLAQALAAIDGLLAGA